MRTLVWTGLLVFALDQLSKLLVLLTVFPFTPADLFFVDGPLPSARSVVVIPGILELHMAWNRGINFGIGAGFDARWLLIGVAVAISAAVLIWLWRSGGSRWHFIAGGLLVGGALGNVVDRVIYGAVADFLNVSCCGIDNPFAFNIADVAIFLGAVGLALLPDASRKTPRKAKT